MLASPGEASVAALLETSHRGFPRRSSFSAVRTWRRRGKGRGELHAGSRQALTRLAAKHLNQQEVADEINRRIDEGKLDNGGRHVSLAWVRTAVAGTERLQDDWNFAKATPEEVELIAPIYEWAVSNGEVDPWPNPLEADWWVKLRTLAPNLPLGQVFRVGRFAALRPAARQQGIAAMWMLWSIRGEAEVQRHRLPTRTAQAASEYQVGGTAIADMYLEASAVPHGGPAVP